MADKPGAMVPPAAVPAVESAGATVEGVPDPKYDWMGLSAEWGTRVRPGEHGLRISDLNVGIYGEVPEVWNDQTRRPRGALPRPGVPPLPYHLRSKHQVGAESAADLYEEEKGLLKPFFLLTMKPTMYVANVDERGFHDKPLLERLEAYAQAEGAPVVPVCAKLESEIADSTITRSSIANHSMPPGRKTTKRPPADSQAASWCRFWPED